MAAVPAAGSQKSRRTFEVGLDFISRCSKVDYLYYRGMGIRKKSYHGYGNGQGDINVVDRHCGMQYLSCCRVYDYPKKIRPHFHAVVQRNRKSRDIQSPSQRRCELNCADSRAVTKRGSFDCEPVFTYNSVCERK